MKNKEKYNLVHSKAERKKNKKNKGGKNNSQQNGGNNKGNGGGAFSPQGKSSVSQRSGEFTFDTIHGLKLKEMEYKVPPMSERKAKRNDFNGGRDADGNIIGGGVRSNFLKMLVEKYEPVLVERLGLTARDLDGMKHGYTPNGFNVHHKLSLHGSGKNEFPNFILTPLYPHDQWHHDIIDPQIAGIREGESRKIFIPWTDEMIYDPKKYGFTKDNEKVNPNYSSNVNPEKYLPLYKSEHINVAKREKDMASFYAELDAKKAEKMKEVAEAVKVVKASSAKGDKKGNKTANKALLQMKRRAGRF